MLARKTLGWPFLMALLICLALQILAIWAIFRRPWLPLVTLVLCSGCPSWLVELFGLTIL
jgi:hypothetical protein